MLTFPIDKLDSSSYDPGSTRLIPPYLTALRRWFDADFAAQEIKGILDTVWSDLLQTYANGYVLEIGAGLGESLSCYPSGISLTVSEPCESRRKILVNTAENLPYVQRVIPDRTEALNNCRDQSYDVVTSKCVLCSVVDLDVSLREVCRVLKPDGKFIFLEHVASPIPAVRILQTLRSLSMGGECKHDRDTAAFIRKAGFSQVNIAPLPLPFPADTPMIAGIVSRA